MSGRANEPSRSQRSQNDGLEESVARAHETIYHLNITLTETVNAVAFARQEIAALIRNQSMYNDVVAAQSQRLAALERAVDSLTSGRTECLSSALHLDAHPC